MRYHAHREKERHRRRRRRTQTKKTHACDQKIRCLHSIILTKQVLASGTGRYHYWPSQQCSKRQYQASPATKVPAAQRRSLISSWFQLPKLSGYFDLRTVEYSYVRRIFFFERNRSPDRWSDLPPFSSGIPIRARVGARILDTAARWKPDFSKPFVLA